MSETSPDLSLLRRYELRLLRCTISPPSPKPPNPSPSDQSSSSHPLSSLISSLLTSIESGRYLDALTCADANRLVSKLDESDSLHGPERVYSELLRRVESFICDEEDDKDKAYRVVVVLCIAVAALLAFTQSNLTGPVEGLRRCPLPLEVALCDDEWDNWARNQLMAAGSDLLGKVYNVQYIVYAKILVMKMKDLLFEGSETCTYGIRSLSWWLARVTFLHQRILNDQSSSLFDLLHVSTSENLNHFGMLGKVTNYWGSDLRNGEGEIIVSVIHLEAGMMEYIYGRVDPCRSHFELAEAAAGVKLSAGIISDDIQAGGTAADPSSAIHQAVVLARCLLIEKSTRNGEMQRWETAPYIEAIDSQLSSNFMISRCCDVVRVRWESTRSHPKQHALMMMETLVQGINKPSPGVAERIPFCYGIYIPTISALQKEYGELRVRCRLVGEAVKIFEDLELWDNLIFCYSLMEKKAAAVELIKKRLSETPNDPRLLCSLGDVTNDDACFKKALEVSNDKSARAKRSLARSAYRKGEYGTSKLLWESVMALNSLFPDDWSALGAAALKDRDIEKALDGFTRAVQLDPENREAWNNIACLELKAEMEGLTAEKEQMEEKLVKLEAEMWDLKSERDNADGVPIPRGQGAGHGRELKAEMEGLKAEKEQMEEKLVKLEAEMWDLKSERDNADGVPIPRGQGAGHGRLPLIYLAHAGLFVVLSALLIFYDISDFSTGRPGTLIDAFYVTMTTLLSVGFGDLAPLRLITQLFTDVLALLGPFLVAILAHFLLRLASELEHRLASELEHTVFFSAVGSCTRRRVLVAFSMILLTTILGMFGIYFFEWERLPDRSSPPSLSPSSCPSPSPPGLLPATSSRWELLIHIFHLSVMMMTTTGFGDYAFTTASGRLFATIWMPICTSVFAAASGFLAETFFIYLTHVRDDSLPQTIQRH